jgi:aryl sulfotransferase
VTARHPLDAAVSMYHQRSNIERGRLQELVGQPKLIGPTMPRKPLHDWLLAYITGDAVPWIVRGHPREYLNSLPGHLWHLSDAWRRRREPGVMLVRYEDLAADLGGQMDRIAQRLGIAVPGSPWPALVQAATFAAVRSNAGQLVPATGIFRSSEAFFRRGTPGAAREILSTEELAAYHARVAQLAAADLLAWLHAPGHA